MKKILHTNIHPFTTLQWQDADTEVFQLAEGTDEVQFLLDGWRTVCDQLETCPDEDNDWFKHRKHDYHYCTEVTTLGDSEKQA